MMSMNFFTKRGDHISAESNYGSIKAKNVDIHIDTYIHYYRVLNLDWKELPVKLVATDAKILHPQNSQELNLIFENIDTKSEDFGVQYLAQVSGWQLHKIKFIFEAHPFQFVASSGFVIIVLTILYIVAAINS